MTQTNPDLLIIGVSTRAAAFSARRAGLTPLCLDAYADVDLEANATVRKISDYPGELCDALKALPELPVMYVGGLENQPEVIDVAEANHLLLGNNADVVSATRDHTKLVDVARMAQVQLPESRDSQNQPEADGSWLLRPIFGSGGRGIVHWTEEARESEVLQEPHFFQKFVAGTPYSAVFVASGQAGDVRFVGVTRQLIGRPECNAVNFQWCGNIGPSTLSIPVEHKMRRIGNVLKFKLGLKGVFGVDFIVTDQEDVYVTEVNPRYPASLELLEHATGHALLGGHVAAFADVHVNHQWDHEPPSGVFGKAILYTPCNFTLDLSLTDQVSSWSEFPTIGDIPRLGTQFSKGDPICTLFAAAETGLDCEERLIASLSEMQSRLGLSVT